MTGQPPLMIDVVADFTCPWCHVGVRSLIAALPLLARDAAPLVRFRAYSLNPATPREGLDRESYYRTKFPDPDFRAAARARLIAAATEAGFTFDPAIPTRLPPTGPAHVVLRRAHAEGRQIACAAALYDAYWQEGADLGDAMTLADIAVRAGLGRTDVAAALADPEAHAAIAQEADVMRAAGVSGVPTFIVNERTGFSGALAPASLAEALQHARRQSMETA